MSNLTSLFDVLAGRPPHDRSAMEGDFEQKAAESPVLSEGMIVKIEDKAGASGTPVVTKLTSGDASATVAQDYPWVVIEGMDMTDTQVAKKVCCLACKSGVIFKVATAGSFTIGDLVYSLAGVLTKVAAHPHDNQAVGQVIGVGTGYIVVAC